MTSVLARITSPIDPGYDALSWSGLNVQASGVKLAISKVDQRRRATPTAWSPPSPRRARR
jgi:hypothetical protein